MWVEGPWVSVGGVVSVLFPSEKENSNGADDYDGDTTENAAYNGPCVRAIIEGVRMILL